MKKFLMLLLTAGLAMVLAACGNESSEEEAAPTEPAQQAQEPVEISEEEEVAEDTSVAAVNDTEITGEKYNPVYLQVKTQLSQSGQDVSDLQQVRELTLNLLVEEELILQDAAEKGIEVTDEEVQSQLDLIKEQTGEELTAVLEQLRLTEEQFKAQLTDDLTTSKYMDSEFEVEVTDEEVQEFYDQLQEQGSEVGELGQMEDLIREQLTMNKTQQLLADRVVELKENADVKMLI
ncbi:SurA N-terminal domain-containing protein [Lentibacillus sediminis]|uniref:SurA N-terminal domain-containing protein n=1 Tax=Lentibacillus sediminis TaxID=1940529 RepID=UPI000C1C1707|nr:SurA N-terminal domain-containing protein [Lentibacillus sediminis]